MSREDFTHSATCGNMIGLRTSGRGSRVPQVMISQEHMAHEVCPPL